MNKDLKIKIPRGKWYRVDERWNLIRKHGKSRKAMVDFICGIGGYCDRFDRFAIEFDVKLYGADLDADHLWSIVYEGDDFPEIPPEDVALARQVFTEHCEANAEELFAWAQEDVVDAYKQDSSPDSGGFTAEYIQWSWELRGRQGGHAVLTQCDGLDLDRSEEDLRDALMEREYETHGDWIVDNRTVRKLFIVCVQCSVEWTHEKLCKELEYRAAWVLWFNGAESEVQRRKEARTALIADEARRAELTDAAGTILCMLQEGDFGDVGGAGSETINAFRDICTLAGITLPEQPDNPPLILEFRNA